MDGHLKNEFDYYLKHQDDFVREFEGKVVVLKDHKVIGVYDDELEAVKEAEKSNSLGTFLVQRVERGSGSTTQTFHSRVAFEEECRPRQRA